MPPFDVELRVCLDVVLGAEPPEPEVDALVFFKQWLAERNLGLVPVADPSTFEWAGPWLARVRAGDGDHAVVMFGSPSGPLHDPGGAYAAGGTIAEGWVLARLDVRLPIEGPYGRDRPRRGGAGGCRSRNRTDVIVPSARSWASSRRRTPRLRSFVSSRCGQRQVAGWKVTAITPGEGPSAVWGTATN